MVDLLEVFSQGLPADITFKAWKRVPVEDGHKMIIVDETIAKEEFITLLLNETKEFSEHVPHSTKNCGF